MDYALVAWSYYIGGFICGIAGCVLGAWIYVKAGER